MTAPALVVGGWVLVTPTTTHSLLGATLPPTVLSISDCIQEDLPRPPWWDWFTDRAEAEEARREHAPHATLVCVAMTEPGAEELAGALDGYGALDLLDQRVPLSPDATVLGYEVVGAEETLDFHSWLCRGYVDDAAAELGIRTNGHGLVPTNDEAEAIRRWIFDPAGPVPWCVVALALDDPAEVLRPRPPAGSPGTEPTTPSASRAGANRVRPPGGRWWRTARGDPPAR